MLPLVYESDSISLTGSFEVVKVLNSLLAILYKQFEKVNLSLGDEEQGAPLAFKGSYTLNIAFEYICMYVGNQFKLFAR